MKERKFDVLLFIQIIFAVYVITIGIYHKVTGDYRLLSLMMMFMGLMLFIMGVRQYKKTRKKMWGIFSIGVSIFILYVTIDALSLI